MIDRDFAYHQQLTLENFTVFADQTLEFVPGINVLIGENGTGKTHLMKALYAWQMARHLAGAKHDGKYESVFAETFGVAWTGELQRTKSRTAIVTGSFGGDIWSVRLQSNKASDNEVRPETPRPIFIPAIEMMAHARNMIGILRDYADFDRTYFDFIGLMTSMIPLPVSEAQPSRNGSMLSEVSALKKLIAGEIEWDEEQQRFYLIENKRRLPFSLVAEGVRKISALYYLSQSSWLAPGSILFWDEPEVNLNPKWMDDVIQVLVALARSGVQIFLATHSYVILKEIDLVLRAEDQTKRKMVQARFLGLSKKNDLSVATWTDDFASVKPNPILDQYDDMIERDWRLPERGTVPA